MKWYEQLLALLAIVSMAAGGLILFLIETLAWTHNKSIFQRRKKRK